MFYRILPFSILEFITLSSIPSLIIEMNNTNRNGPIAVPGSKVDITGIESNTAVTKKKMLK